MEISPLRRFASPTLVSTALVSTALASSSLVSSPRFRASADVVETTPALPSDQVSLSQDPPRRSPLRLANVAWTGLSALGILGGMVANVSAAAQTPAQVQVAPAQSSQARPVSLTDMVASSATADHPQGWLLAANPASPQDTLRVEKLSKPSLHKGDYVRHGVNFSNLLSDAEFTNVNSTRQQDIQAYLQEIDSWLANTPVDGERSAAEVIMNTAKTHNINPWALLATLEKETSLVSRTAPPSHKTLRKSMGYAYNDGGSKAGKQSNFVYQLDKGAELLKNLYDEGQQLTFPRKMTVDYGKRTITVRNAATYALTRYTPHTVDTKLHRIGGGNYLFRKHMDRMVKTFLSNAPQAAPPAILLASD